MDDASELLIKNVEEHLKTKMHYPYITDVKLIYNKTLSESDMMTQTHHFSIAYKDILTPFLSDCERLYLSWLNPDGTNTSFSVNVVVGSTHYNLTFSRAHCNYYYYYPRNTNNPNNTNNEMRRLYKNELKYVINTRGWNQLKVDNNFKSGDLIKVVSFRSNNFIGFVFLASPAPPGRPAPN